MAEKSRIKVQLGDIQPSFWLLIDKNKCRSIADVMHVIQGRYTCGTITSLLLDGCVLPSDESSELLRDGDNVHVVCVNTTAKELTGLKSADLHARQPKRERNGVEVDPQDSVGSIQSELKEEHSILSVDGTADRDREKKKHKKEKKEKKKRALSDESGVRIVAEFGEQTFISPATKEQKQVKSKETVEPEKTAESVLDNASCDADDVSAVKRKRRVRKRKKGKYSQEVPVDQPCLPVKNPSPAPLRLAKWNKPLSKKIKFSSDEDSDDAKETVREQTKGNSTIPRAANNCSLKASTSSVINPFTTVGQGSEAQSRKDDTSSSDNTSVSSADVNSVPVARANGVELDTVGMNGVDDLKSEEKQEQWNTQSLIQLIHHNRNKGHKKSPAKSPATSFHYDYGDQHQNTQSSAAQNQQMAPQEPGASHTPYVKARRLTNGAMVYTRMTGSGNTSVMDGHTSVGNGKASPRSQSKHRQLDVVNTNRSIVLPSQAQAEVPSGRWGTGVLDHSSSQETDAANRPDVVSFTPIGREYSLFPDLITAPKVGDKIAYKVLEMGENYCPGISDYKEAKVLGYEAGSQCVTVKILKTEFAKEKQPGRFDLPVEETGEEEVDEIELSSMLEPKLMSSA